jgi:zinc transport system ATP-binding protein
MPPTTETLINREPIPAGERLISIENLSAGFGGAKVLDVAGFHIDAGEIVTVVGPNGSGKSTLMRLIVGAIQPSAGQIIRRPNLRLGYVPQKLSIDPTLPLNVRRFLNLPRRHARTDLDRVVDQTGIAHLLTRPVSGLSGRQYQRVLLARALLQNPELLILDEPTQGLDQRGSADFYALIETIRAKTGVSVLMVSHELHVVMSASDRVICLNGHVCCQGTPDVVRSAPEYRALFGEGTHGALALYRHHHDHHHDHDHDHDHDHGHAHDQDHTHKHGHDRRNDHDPLTSGPKPTLPEPAKGPQS